MSNVPRALLATASASPSGAQAIASIRAPSPVTCRSGAPSADQSQTSSAPVLAETYAMRRPVGDQAGMKLARWPIPPIPTVSRVSAPPSGETLQSSGPPPSEDTKTIWLPSGDQRGASAPPTERIASS